MAVRVKCPECDGPNSDDAKVCRWCNTDLRGVHSVLATVHAPPPESPSIARSLRLAPSDRAHVFDARMHASAESQATTVVVEPPSVPEGLVRLPTHVTGLDEVLGGGLPEGYVVLLEGGPGTMKSSLALWTLAHNAAKDGRRGLYLSFEESAGSLFKQMTSLGLPLAEASDRLVIADPTQLGRTVRGGKQDWLDSLRKIVEPLQRDGLKLFALDSLGSLDTHVRFRERPHELMRFFDWLRELGLASIIVAERSEDGSRESGVVHQEDFLADGIIQLRLRPVGEDDVQRRLRVVKMRGVLHEANEMAFWARTGQLLVAAPSGPQLEELPPPPPPV